MCCRATRLGEAVFTPARYYLPTRRDLECSGIPDGVTGIPDGVTGIVC